VLAQDVSHYRSQAMQELLDDHNATYNPDGKVPGSIPTQLFPTGAHPICISRVVEIPLYRTAENR